MWNTGCICQVLGSISWYVTRFICFVILKGPYHFGASLVDWCGSLRWVPSSQTCSLMLNWAMEVSPAFLLMALVAWYCACIMHFTHFSTASLSILIASDGANSGVYPSRIWLGDKPVMVLIWLLCTAKAMEIQRDQSSGCDAVMVHKYCSTHWFFHLDKPSVWGWKAVDRFCWIPSFLVSALLKWDVNWGSLSLIIFVGRPNHL